MTARGRLRQNDNSFLVYSNCETAPGVAANALDVGLRARYFGHITYG
jgi:hypothetical protein